MGPSVEYIIAVLSVLRCGEAFLPLDPSWPKERILSILSSSKVEFVIACQSSVDGNCFHHFEESYWLVDSSSCPVLFISSSDNTQEQHGSSCLIWPCEDERLRTFCYLMYTSGSTGEPKGVCGTELGLLNRFLWIQEFYPLHGDEILLFKTPIFFIDHLQEFLGALLTACTLVIPPFNELKENLFSVVAYLQAYFINRLVTVPSLMRAILPALQAPHKIDVHSSLKLLVLSGEVLPVSLWNMLSKLLPETGILNLYGSTEVSGDCTYFDCKKLPLILESEALSSVPIGMPMSNCDVMLVGGDAPDEGEVCVGGLCLAAGYFGYPSINPLACAELAQDSCFGCTISEHGGRYYFKTGDFARKLQTGDLVFLGRKDRSIKVNGQRIALEEIEITLRRHLDVLDAAVISHKSLGEVKFLEAYLVTRQHNEYGENLRSSIRSWMLNKLPLAMIPNRFFFLESFPRSSTGKVDYVLLGSLRCSLTQFHDVSEGILDSDLLQAIKKAFCNALMVEKVCNDDDFFSMGGDSISAAHVSHSLGIDMRLLYSFPSPLKLEMVLLEKDRLCNQDVTVGAPVGVNLITVDGNWFCSVDSRTSFNFYGSKTHGRLTTALSKEDADHPVKYLRMDSDLYMNLNDADPRYRHHRNSGSIDLARSFGRCNKIMHEGETEENKKIRAPWSVDIPRGKKVSLQEFWKVHMESCVDASPLVVFKESDVYLFIGSHSHKFICINAQSGRSN